MSRDFIIHHPQVQSWIEGGIDVAEVRRVLTDAGTFRFEPLASGLFAAADLDAETGHQTGYGRAWTRDNVHVGHALWRIGDQARGAQVARALLKFYARQRFAFEACIEDPEVAKVAMNRPHIRFDGVSLEALDQKWTHAQNDALGYFGWLVALMASAGDLAVWDEDAQTLARWVRYLEAIRYWRDADSGHWEERLMVHASSIGPVVAGLEATAAALRQGRLPAAGFASQGVDADRIEALAKAGRAALAEILPHEARQPVEHARGADAAVLFLVYPLGLYPVESEMGQRIVDFVVGDLAAPRGIRRYLEDSYWAPDFDVHIADVEARTQAEDATHLDIRDELYQKGQEAQWCLFDATLASAYARGYARTQDPAHRDKQNHFLHRALGQLTGPDAAVGPFKMPEAYYLKGEAWIPNPHTPLLWSAANLQLALFEVEAASRAR